MNLMRVKNTTKINRWLKIIVNLMVWIYLVSQPAVFAAGISRNSQTVDKTELVSKTRKKFEENCRASYSKKGAAAEDARALYCECMPREMDSVETSFPDDKPVVVDQFVDKVNHYLGVCSARLLKQSVTSSCRDSGPGAPGSDVREQYCLCVEKGVWALSDEELAEDLDDGKKKSTDPAKSKVQQILKGCR